MTTSLHPVVVIVLGLSGSGKSKLASELEAAGFLKFDEGVYKWWSGSSYGKLMTSVANGKDCVVVDIAYMVERERAELIADLRAQRPDADVRWICFENNLERANENCRRDRRRTPEQVVGNLKQNALLTRGYSFPRGAEIREIVVQETASTSIP